MLASKFVLTARPGLQVNACACMHWQRIAQLCSIPGILIAAEYILMYSLQLSSGCLQTHACSLLGNNIHFRVVSFLIKFLLAFPVEACIVFHS